MEPARFNSETERVIIAAVPAFSDAARGQYDGLVASNSAVNSRAPLPRGFDAAHSLLGVSHFHLYERNRPRLCRVAHVPNRPRARTCRTSRRLSCCTTPSRCAHYLVAVLRVLRPMHSISFNNDGSRSHRSDRRWLFRRTDRHPFNPTN
jgi:hypothetical protein